MQIETVTTATFELVLPLIADYQRFYQAIPDEARNRAHFGRFIDNHTDGIQFVMLDDERNATGFATLYFPYSSVSAGSFCLLNDLFTIAEMRGHGIGRALIMHCAHYATTRGFRQIEWRTQESNTPAQRLYNSLDTSRSTWYSYTLKPTSNSEMHS